MGENPNSDILGFGGYGEINPVLRQPDRLQHPKTGLRINPKPYCGILGQRISEMGDTELLTEKGHIFVISMIFHITSTLCLVKPSLLTNTSPLDTLIVYFNHYDHFKKKSLCLIQVVFQRVLASSVGVKDGTLTSRAVTLVHPKRFLGNNL